MINNRSFYIVLFITLNMLPVSVLGQTFTTRPDDHLLSRPDLQYLVELQTQRNGKELIRSLSSHDPSIRGRAAFALASVQDSLAIPFLVQLLQDSEDDVRADAAFALGQSYGSVSSDSLFSALMREAAYDVQLQLLDALGKKGDLQTLQKLATWNAHRSLEEGVGRAISRFSLRGLHHPEAVKRLVTFLQSQDPAVRRQAAYYFGRTPTTEPWSFVSDTLYAILRSAGPVDPAAGYLLQAVARLGRPEDTSLLIKWAHESDDWRIRTVAARAMASRLPEPNARRTLLEMLSDSSEHVRVTAAETIAGFEGWEDAGVETIIQWIRDHPEAWRVSALLLLVPAKKGHWLFISEEIERRKGSPLAYAHALRALASAPASDALAALTAAASSQDLHVAYAALNTLYERWKEDRSDPTLIPVYFQAFADALQRRDLAASYVAAQAFEDSLFRPLGAPGLLATTYRQMKAPEDIEPMTAILNSLGSVGDSSMATMLQTELQSAHPILRAAAADALQKLTGVRYPAAPVPARFDKTLDWKFLATLGRHPHLILRTDKGLIDIMLDAEQAPFTSQTLLQLAAAGAYDGVPFHRVVPNFVVQGGDIERGDGFGGPGFVIPSEFTRILFREGATGIASAGKDTEGSQYFITHSMQPHLDGRYTAFGYVAAGMQVVDRIYEGDLVRSTGITPEQP